MSTQAEPAAVGRYEISETGVEVGPHTHLRRERERLASLRWEHFDARPIGATIGGEISGIRLGAGMGDAVIAELRQALLDYKVLVFHDQGHLDEDGHVDFAGRFGDLEVHPFLQNNVARPELVRFEKTPDVGGYENAWHSDVSWREEPALGAVLRAVQAPISGGDTLFCDMYAVFGSLDPALQDRLRALRAVHDFSHTFGHVVPEDEKAEMRAKFPPVAHPIVRTHPETGRELLYVNGIFVSHVEDMDPEESRALLTELYQLPHVPEFGFRHRWSDGDVVFWDNRAVQHYASSDYWPASRIMERASIIGDRPF